VSKAGANIVGSSARRGSASANKGNGDLLSSMSQRLAKLESLNTALKSELQEKNQRIQTLESTNAVLKDAADMGVAQKLKQMELDKIEDQR
jgi:hypothetical protein